MSPSLIEITRAQELVAARVGRVGAEPVALEDALGRVLAEDVTSADDVPGFDNSAMDGYAVLAADTADATAEAPASLSLVDESRAGHPATRTLEPGRAIAISTGAMLPAGADAVVRIEDTARSGDRVEVRARVEAGRDIRRAGEDVNAGQRVLEAGTELGPAELGVLASVGRGDVRCARRPRVTVLTTGDELQEPGSPLRPGAIRNSNTHAIGALVERSGAELIASEIVPDDAEATAAAIARSLKSEVLVVCGGVSVGPHDHVRPALEKLGVEQIFWGVKLRPGKPTFFGVGPARDEASGPRTLVFGLPGNPVSAMVTFGLFARPAIRAMMGAAERPRRATAILDSEHRGMAERTQLVRCRLRLAADGWHAEPTGAQGSHVLTSMLDADALVTLPPREGTFPAGTTVEIELLR